MASRGSARPLGAHPSAEAVQPPSHRHTVTPSFKSDLALRRPRPPTHRMVTAVARDDAGVLCLLNNTGCSPERLAEVRDIAHPTAAIHLEQLGMCRSPDGQLSADRSVCKKVARTVIALASQPQLVVVGAHYFGFDHNDPLFYMVRNIPWSAAVLVEASPPIAARLAQLYSPSQTKKPLPFATPSGVRVVNEGVCPADQSGSLPFYSLTSYPRGPRWVSQMGSFNRSHVEKHLRPLVKPGWSMSKLQEAVSRNTVRVPCGPLPELLGRHGAPAPDVLMLDLEGLDCRVIAMQNWCALRPRLLIFESAHCEPEDLLAAKRSIARDCPDGRYYATSQGGSGVSTYQNTIAVLTDRSHGSH